MNKRYTLSEIQSLESGRLGKMSDKELKKLVADSARIANARLKRLEQSGLSEFSRAYNSNVRKSHKHFGVGTKTKRASLRNEFKAIREFLNMKTSTVSGVKAVQRKVDKELGLTFPSARTRKKFWKAYREVEERGDLAGVENGSPRVIEKLHQVLIEDPHRDALRSLVREINTMNNYGRYTDEELQKMTSNKSKMYVIMENGKLMQVRGTRDDIVYLLAENTEKLFREMRDSIHREEGEYNDL